MPKDLTQKTGESPPFNWSEFLQDARKLGIKTCYEQKEFSPLYLSRLNSTLQPLKDYFYNRIFPYFGIKEDSVDNRLKVMCNLLGDPQYFGGVFKTEEERNKAALEAFEFSWLMHHGMVPILG